MPISIEEFKLPAFIKYQERYPYSYDKKDRYNDVNPIVFAERSARYNQDGVVKQAGYNPHHQSTRVERINLRSDDITLKPY